MFSSPTLTEFPNAKIISATTTATVSAVINSPLKRLQRPSAFFNAVKTPLLSLKHHEKGEDKARKTLGVIMSVFIICWVPFFILALLKSQNLMYVPKWLDVLVSWLGYSNRFAFNFFYQFFYL